MGRISGLLLIFERKNRGFQWRGRPLPPLRFATLRYASKEVIIFTENSILAELKRGKLNAKDQ